MLRGAGWLLRARRYLVQPAGRARARRGLARGGEASAGGAAADGGDRPGRGWLPGLWGDRRGRGRRVRRLHDIPAFGAPVRAGVAAASLPMRGAGLSGRRVHRGPRLAPSRAKLTVRAAWWAISCIQRDNASVASVARRLGVDWHTVWDAIKPLLEELADDPGRLAGVDTLGVDEHIVRHEALLFRMEVRDLDRFAVAAAG